LEQAAILVNLDDKLVGLALSNDPSMDGTNMFIDSYKIINNSPYPNRRILNKEKPNITNESDKEPLVLMLIRYHLRVVKCNEKSSDQDFYRKI
jgi:hypothetical protein